MPRACEEKGAYEDQNEEKGANEKQNEGNVTKFFLLSNNQKVPRAYENLNTPLMIKPV